MTTKTRLPIWDSIGIGVLAGTSGGLAEVLWIWFYGALSNTDTGVVARGVSAAVGAGWVSAPIAVGIAIHMILAVALGIALAFAIRPVFARLHGVISPFAIVVSVLTVVWAVNFLIVLPRISPAFIDLLPYQVTLFSKLLFSFAAATVLRSKPAQVRHSQH